MPPPGLPQDTKDRIVALYREGMTARQITRVIDGVTVHQIYDVIRIARDSDAAGLYRGRKGARGRKGETFKGRVLRLYIPAVVLSRVAARAQTRGTTTETLIAHLVEAVAIDDLFAAVLDD